MSLHYQLARLSRKFPPSRTKVRAGRILTYLTISNKATTDAIVEVEMRDGSRMLLDPRSRTEAGPYWNGVYEPDYVDFLKICLEPGDALFDVGANVGLITVPLGRFLKEIGGKAYSFEPVKPNYDRLVAAVQRNGLTETVAAFNVALGDENGKTEIAVESSHGQSTGNAVLKRGMGDEAGHAVSEIEIKRLDDFVQKERIARVNVVKVDIEGAEVLFLKGGSEFLRQHRPIILGEFHSGFIRNFGHTFLDAADIIKPWDYRIYAFAGRLKLKEVTEPYVGLGDVVLVPKEKCIDLLKRIDARPAG